MSRSPRLGLGSRVTGLVALALFAVAPFFGTARATADDDLREIAARIREFRAQVKGGELTPRGIDKEAARLIALKTDFVLASEQASGVYLEPYLDLARIDEGLDKTRRNAKRVGRAVGHLQGGIAATRELVGKLFGRADAAQYASSVDCLEGLERGQEELADEMRGGGLRPGEIRVRANELVAVKMSCIEAWPPVFGESFLSIYGFLSNIDHALETIADPPDDSVGDVVAALRRALGSTQQLRREIEEWTTGSPAPSGTASSRPSPGPSSSAGPSTSPSVPPSVTPAPSGEPTPEESPTGINPKPPSVSAITASFDPETHSTSYSITASDADNDELTFSWAKSEERACGTFTGNGRNATWGHGEPPCPVEGTHPGTISVFVSDGIYTCSAFYEGGSASGTGPPAECGGAPRP